jgi:hypothetical protein
MRTLVISLAIAVVATVAFAAAYSKVPAQFVGDWCQDNPAEEPGTYRFGPCLPHENSNGEGWLTVRPDGIAARDKRCRVIEAASDKKSNYLVTLRCSSGGNTWTQNYWMSLQLLMGETTKGN